MNFSHFLGKNRQISANHLRTKKKLNVFFLDFMAFLVYLTYYKRLHLLACNLFAENKVPSFNQVTRLNTNASPSVCCSVSCPSGT